MLPVGQFTGKLALFLVSTHFACAQYVVSTRAGTIHYVEGQVSVDGQPVRNTPQRFPMLGEGQVLRTSDGKAEVLLGSGVFVRLGDHSALRMVNAALEDSRVEVQQGSVLVEVVEMTVGRQIHVMLGPASTEIAGPGLQRFEAASHELRVFGGHAVVTAGDRRVEAGRGRVVRLGDTLAVSKFDPRRKDALHQWAASRSFLLYLSSLEAGTNGQRRPAQTNWELTRVSPTAVNLAITTDQDHVYLVNRDFGVMFQSSVAVRASAAR